MMFSAIEAQKFINMTAPERWSKVVELVRSNQVSDISVFETNITARLEGRVVHLSEDGALSRNEVQQLIAELIKLYPGGASAVAGAMDLRMTLLYLTAAWFRINLAHAQGVIRASLRPLPDSPPDLLEIGISKRIAALLVALTEGLILVSGPTGSGKTTTIAGIIEAINLSRPAKVLTIEDPLNSFSHKEPSRNYSTRSWPRPAFLCRRFAPGPAQNPDVIVVGEIRKTYSVLAALQAAETGHLVIGSVHASSVVETVRRLILLAPESAAAEVRYVFARTMRLLIKDCFGGKIRAE